jgi:CBS domain containing-hemolysin-like protein
MSLSADPLVWIGGAAVLAGLVAIFALSLAEASLLAVSEVALRKWAETGSRAAGLVQRLRQSHDYLSAIIVGINAMVIGVSTLMTLLVHRILPDAPHWQVETCHAGAILSILVFAELTPKTWGALAPRRPALAMAPAVASFTRVVGPAVRLLAVVAEAVAGPPAKTQGHSRHFITRSEIQAAVDIGQEEGVVEPEEGEMVDSVMELGETVAREIIVPRVGIVAVPDTASAEEAVRIAVESGHSRIPVFHHTIDSITGILYVNDMLREFARGNRDISPADIAREPVYVPETKRVSELFRELRDASVHIAVVLDEYGGTEGLVTIEDILEELVGDIADEHDLPDLGIVPLSDTEALVDGKARISEVNEQLDLDLPEDDYETIGGLVAGQTGRIPAVGETITVGTTALVVESGTEQHVERVRVLKAHTEGGDV